MDEDKTHMNIAFIGHVDSGKSDTTAHLIGNLGVADGKFETSKHNCTVTDAHEQADCALLVIDSTSSVPILSKDGHTEQTLRAFALGRQQLICCCCIIEMQTAAFSKHHYDGIVREASSYLKSLGFNHNQISFVPISGPKGNNMIEVTNLEWYKGPTLHEAIDQINRPKRPARGESSHKNLLQEFSLKKYQKYPVYNTRSQGEPRDCKFWCTIEVDGQRFESVHLHVHKKEAEQDAAKVAYEFLMARDGDNFVDVITLIDKDLLLCKTILYEYTIKKKISQPSYSFHRERLGRMTFNAAKVCVAGKEYVGEIGKSKRDAAENAAHVAVKSILDTIDECMLKVFRSKRRLTTRTPYSLYNKEGATRFPCVISVPSNQPSMKHTTKTSAPKPEAPDLSGLQLN